MRLFLNEFFDSTYYKRCLAWEVCEDYSRVNGVEIEQYDEITPGIGQIIQIDNIIVPIYHTSDLTIGCVNLFKLS